MVETCTTGAGKRGEIKTVGRVRERETGVKLSGKRNCETFRIFTAARKGPATSRKLLLHFNQPQAHSNLRILTEN